jgi:hypothetical protein
MQKTKKIISATIKIILIVFFVLLAFLLLYIHFFGRVQRSSRPNPTRSGATRLAEAVNTYSGATRLAEAVNTYNYAVREFENHIHSVEDLYAVLDNGTFVLIVPAQDGLNEFDLSVHFGSDERAHYLIGFLNRTEIRRDENICIRWELNEAAIRATN